MKKKAKASWSRFLMCPRPSPGRKPGKTRSRWRRTGWPSHWVCTSNAVRKSPCPAPVAAGQVLIAVPPIVAAKLALYSAMRSQGITNVALAARLGLSEGAVRRLVNPDHRSHISQVEKALRAVGRNPRRRGQGGLRVVSRDGQPTPLSGTPAGWDRSRTAARHRALSDHGAQGP